jgi:hypothetical protein
MEITGLWERKTFLRKKYWHNFKRSNVKFLKKVKITVNVGLCLKWKDADDLWRGMSGRPRCFITETEVTPHSVGQHGRTAPWFPLEAGCALLCWQAACSFTDSWWPKSLTHWGEPWEPALLEFQTDSLSCLLTAVSSLGLERRTQ